MPLMIVQSSEVHKQVIHHELGHWLMARHMGFDVGDIVVKKDTSGAISGSTTVYPIPNKKFNCLDDIYLHMFNRIVVLIAGVVADVAWQQKKYPSINITKASQSSYEEGIMDDSGLNDQAKILELMYILIAIKNYPGTTQEERDSQMNEIFSKAWYKASEVIENNDCLFYLGGLMVQNYINHPEGMRYFKQDLLQMESTYIEGIR